MARVRKGKYTMELTQEEMNTIILALGDTSQPYLDEKSEEYGVRTDSVFELYQELEQYID